MKALFYSLNAAIWMHSLPENRLVCEAVRSGFEVTYVSCGASFHEHCTTMSAHGLEIGSDQMAEVCRQCKANAAMLVAANGAKHIELRDHLTAEDRLTVAALLSTVSKDNYLSFSYLGVAVGRAAAYELVLKYKKMSDGLSAEEWRYCQIYLENCLISLIGFSRIYAIEKPDAVLFYSPQYGANGVSAQFAELQGARVYFVEGSSSNSERYSALRIWDWSRHGLVNPALNYWNTAQKSLTSSDISRVSGHFSELLKGESFAVYSAPVTGNVDIRQHFKVPPRSKILLMTLSSYDEAYAAVVINRFPASKMHSSVFKDQFEWVKYTVNLLADRPDVFLIIRVHPRDFPNKREQIRSEQSRAWERIFANLPGNVAINWPHERLSLYDLFGAIDVLTTGWSATGVEALALGVPVVTYDQNLPSYPSGIHRTGRTRDEYHRNIDDALNEGRQFKYVRNAYRWLGLSFSLGVVRIAKPIALESYYRYVPRILVGLVFNRFVRRAVRWIDARRALSTAEDKKRFVALLRARSPNLFEVVVSKGDAPASLDTTISQEHFKFARALGVSPVVEVS